MTDEIRKDYWVYILLCENGSYYTGYTSNLSKRYKEHVNGTGRCKYTRGFKPVMIAQCWHVTHSKSLAMQLESKIKRLSKVEKERLIAEPKRLSADVHVKILGGNINCKTDRTVL